MSEKKKLFFNPKNKTKRYYDLLEILNQNEGDVISVGINNLPPIDINKYILYSMSDYFASRSKFNGNCGNQNDKGTPLEIEVDDKDAERMLTAYLMDESFEITMEDVRPLMKWSQYFQFTELIDLCVHLFRTQYIDINWNLDKLSFVIDEVDDLYFGDYVLQLLVKNCEHFFGYYFQQTILKTKKWGGEDHVVTHTSKKNKTVFIEDWLFEPNIEGKKTTRKNRAFDFKRYIFSPSHGNDHTFKS